MEAVSAYQRQVAREKRRNKRKEKKGSLKIRGDFSSRLYLTLQSTKGVVKGKFVAPLHNPSIKTGRNFLGLRLLLAVFEQRQLSY